jgi:hypothetical protein
MGQAKVEKRFETIPVRITGDFFELIATGVRFRHHCHNAHQLSLTLFLSCAHDFFNQAMDLIFDQASATCADFTHAKQLMTLASSPWRECVEWTELDGDRLRSDRPSCAGGAAAPAESRPSPSGLLTPPLSVLLLLLLALELWPTDDRSGQLIQPSALEAKVHSMKYMSTLNL